MIFSVRAERKNFLTIFHLVHDILAQKWASLERIRLNTHVQQLKAFFGLHFLKNVMISMGEYGISEKLW